MSKQEKIRLTFKKSWVEYAENRVEIRHIGSIAKSYYKRIAKGYIDVDMSKIALSGRGEYIIKDRFSFMSLSRFFVRNAECKRLVKLANKHFKPIKISIMRTGYFSQNGTLIVGCQRIKKERQLEIFKAIGENLGYEIKG